jgi:hypothetical protein
MTKNLRALIRELVLQEMNTTSSGGASMSAGTGEQYATPKAFKKTESNKALTVSKKLGFAKTSRPKRPSNTKLFDFLQ